MKKNGAVSADMVSAGANAYRSWGGDREDGEGLAVAIYLAMVAASPEQQRRARARNDAPRVPELNERVTITGSGEGSVGRASTYDHDSGTVQVAEALTGEVLYFRWYPHHGWEEVEWSGHDGRRGRGYRRVAPPGWGRVMIVEKA